VQAAIALWAEQERRRTEILTAVDIAKASIDRGEGIEISAQSMRALAEDVKRRGRAQLAAFRARLGQGKQVVEESAADGVDGKTVSHQLARAYLARHNVRQGGDFAKVVQGWPEPQKAYGSVGAAMAMAGVE